MRNNRGLDEATLDRLEPLVPETVSRLRNSGGDPGNATQLLHRGIEEAVASGELSMTVVSPYGTEYELVNLPTEFREVELSVPEGRYHIGTIEGQVRAWLDDEATSIRELSFAIEGILEQQAAIEQYVSEHEREFETRLQSVESDVESVRAVAAQIDGQVGERARQLVLENRHAEFDGVTAITDGLSDAKRALHRCAFDGAMTRLGKQEAAVDGLLTAVDFLRSLMGGIEHGQTSVRLPGGKTEQLYAELEPLLEEQLDVELSVAGDSIVVEGGEADNDSDDGGQPSVEAAAGGTDSGPDHSVDTVAPASVADEILFILRELKNGASSGGTIEYQTEQLPDAIGRPDVLAALAAFCRRQSTVVSSVTVQEGAPPGFIEIEFVDGTGTAAGLESLTTAFVNRHGTHN
ncbi:hypothetical protein [Haloarcula sediminis]|uniref:hypothetical protein n=1 Tax=Haloarcula sediminis TaxID=3111777 RepID=UPI002D781053|nr:hypothetical protein [Haloarcula sp. CK38]